MTAETGVAAAWHALDFAAAVLAADAEGRDRALDALLLTPREGMLALGTLLLTVAGPHAPGHGARSQLAHMLAMTSLQALEEPSS